MPCQGPSDAEYASIYKRELDALTKAMCELCTVIEGHTLLINTQILNEAPLAKKWWETHKELDAARKAYEEEENRRAKEQETRKKNKAIKEAKKLLRQNGFTVSEKKKK